MPRLPRPVVLLEDGRGVSGTVRLAWGARSRYRLPWTPDAVGRLDWLRTLPPERRLYGVAAYELGLPARARRAEPMVPQPLADFFEPAHELVLDCETGTLAAGDWEELVGTAARHGGSSPPAVLAPAGPPAHPPAFVRRSFTQPAFEAAVRRVKEYIAAGDVYQVNVAVGDLYRTDLSPWDLYGRLRALNPSPWMGFADFGDWQVVSGSPELLLEVGGTAERRNGGTHSGAVRDADDVGRLRRLDTPSGSPQLSSRTAVPPFRRSALIRTRPIAGTRKKTGHPEGDAAMRRELALDDKERAEHRMLVDLARNDVGRVAAYGSVRVSESEVIEEYSHVFHLVSEVTGDLAAGRSTADALAALFPGGTITGAPKLRAMEVIAELEPVGRGAYTGGLGWLGPDGGQFNILIRSAVCRDGAASVHAGAGIVWDSDPEREWRESLRKAAALRAALGTED